LKWLIAFVAKRSSSIVCARDPVVAEAMTSRAHL
jgi:hypothetical protein